MMIAMTCGFSILLGGALLMTSRVINALGLRVGSDKTTVRTPLGEFRVEKAREVGPGLPVYPAAALVLRGSADPFVSKENIDAFKKEMADAKVDFREEVYPGAVHSFTVKEAGDDPSKGMAYDPDADKKSWEDMKAFFSDTLGTK